MNEKLLHTPEGVRDIYGTECLERQEVLGRIRKVLRSYAYTEIETPSFEYFDIFNMDKGSAPSNEMYKFFDRENNTDTLDVHVEMTPDIFTDNLGEITHMQKELSDELHSMLGIKAAVTLVAPKSIIRSEGKAVRIIDNRKL